MTDLRSRFGGLLAAHRRRRGLTQEDLAEVAGLSVDMISKIESGSSGARFPTIERLAAAVQVDPAELFTHQLPSGAMASGALGEISSKLASLSETELSWVDDLLEVALASPKLGRPRLKKSREVLAGAPSRGKNRRRP